MIGLAVSQAVREAAAPLFEQLLEGWGQQVLDGEIDDNEIVQAFARFEAQAFEAGAKAGIEAAIAAYRESGDWDFFMAAERVFRALDPAAIARECQG